MKKTIFLLFLLVSLISFGQKNQTILKSEIKLDKYPLTTFLKVQQNGNQYIFTTPKNADIRLFGWFKAKLARISRKMPKKGILSTIICEKKGDSLIGNVTFFSSNNLKFKGTYKNEILNGKILKNDTVIVGKIEGKKSKENKLNFKYLYPKIIDITSNYIYSKSILTTKEWNNFEKELNKLLNNAQDDIELFIGFRTLKSKLSFSHYNLVIIKDIKELKENSSVNNKTVVYKKENNNTAYLKIKDFNTTKDELANIFPKILQDNPKNLIIDLRDNFGGGIESAFEFGKYVMSGTTEIGYFVTNKIKNSGFNINLYKKLPIAKPQTTYEFIEMLKKGKGAKLMFENLNTPVYSGNIFVLTNHNTASTCEPIVYALKENKRATIIGENTAGAMLSATLFDISGKYKLYLPIADFYTYDGVRLEGVGVKPNIETKSENALNKALEIIKQNEKK